MLQFLVDLLVQRCKLLVCAGYIDKAVAQLQALAEWHFFRPDIPHLRSDVKPKTLLETLRRNFRAFWLSGVPRIGEKKSNG